MAHTRTHGQRTLTDNELIQREHEKLKNEAPTVRVYVSEAFRILNIYILGDYFPLKNCFGCRPNAMLLSSVNVIQRTLEFTCRLKSATVSSSATLSLLMRLPAANGGELFDISIVTCTLCAGCGRVNGCPHSTIFFSCVPSVERDTILHYYIARAAQPTYAFDSYRR